MWLNKITIAEKLRLIEAVTPVKVCEWAYVPE
jgi:hypothetical protein